MGLLSRLWGLVSAPAPVVRVPVAPTQPVVAPPALVAPPRPQAQEPGQEPERECTSHRASDADLAAALQHDLRCRAQRLLESLTHEPDLAYVVQALSEEIADALPQIPAAAQAGLALTVDANVQVQDLVRVFERDPSLAQALLKTANSSYYCSASPCTSIDKAVVKLGRRGLRNVLLNQLMQGLVCRPGAAFGDMPREVWSHMSESAPLARRLAPGFGGNPEEAFALALLHDAGKLVLFEAASAARRKRRREVCVDDPTKIAACLDLLHEPLGGLAVFTWGFGPEVARVVANHHRHPPPQQPSPLSEAVFLADAIQLAGDVNSLGLEALWARGRLSGSPVRVEELPTDTWSRRAIVARS
ncbi:MAG: HDOD domain-containing protein [Planctomycetes bacterium]|nr:HDOD domain-containing protein [Planctomycetota bacterium]